MLGSSKNKNNLLVLMKTSVRQNSELTKVNLLLTLGHSCTPNTNDNEEKNDQLLNCIPNFYRYGTMC